MAWNFNFAIKLGLLLTVWRALYMWFQCGALGVEHSLVPPNNRLTIEMKKTCRWISIEVKPCHKVLCRWKGTRIDPKGKDRSPKSLDFFNFAGQCNIQKTLQRKQNFMKTLRNRPLIFILLCKPCVSFRQFIPKFKLVYFWVLLSKRVRQPPVPSMKSLPFIPLCVMYPAAFQNIAQ